MKIKSLIAVLLLTASNVFAQIPSYVPTNGLVAWWPFNGNANDQSGNGYIGTVNGTALTSDRYGIQNSAYQFNSTNTITTNCPGAIGNGSRTLCFWFKPDALNSSTDTWVIAGYGSGVYAGSSWGAMYYQNNIGTDINSSYAYYNNPISINNWSFITIAFDITNGTNVIGTHIYVNGVRQTSTSYTLNTNVNINTGPANWFFGKNLSSQSYRGKLDDIGIWNRTLTQQEITALYNAQSCTSNTITADGPTTFCAGNSVNLTSDVVGGTYQWKRNGVNITTNGTAKTYKASSTGSYTCVATCNGTALTSNAIAVTSKTNASASVTASGATSFCAGDSVTLNATNLGSNYSVQWYRTNVSIENATTYTQVVKQPGTYKVVTRNLTNGCSRISGSAITTNVNCRTANYSNITTTDDLNDDARFDATELSNGIKIYPNPNNGSFQFKYEGEESGNAQLEVINTMGQTVYQTNVNIEDGFLLKEIMLGDNFQKGIYIVRLLINGGQNDSRVLIQ